MESHGHRLRNAVVRSTSVGIVVRSLFGNIESLERGVDVVVNTKSSGHQ